MQECRESMSSCKLRCGIVLLTMLESCLSLQKLGSCGHLVRVHLASLALDRESWRPPGHVGSILGCLVEQKVRPSVGSFLKWATTGSGERHWHQVPGLCDILLTPGVCV